MLKHNTFLLKYTKGTTKGKIFDNSISLREPKKQKNSTTRS